MTSKQKTVTDPRQPSIGYVMDLIRDIVDWIDIISARLTTHEQHVQCLMAKEQAERNHPAHGKALRPLIRTLTYSGLAQRWP